MLKGRSVAYKQVIVSKDEFEKFCMGIYNGGRFSDLFLGYGDNLSAALHIIGYYFQSNNIDFWGADLRNKVSILEKHCKNLLLKSVLLVQYAKDKIPMGSEENKQKILHTIKNHIAPPMYAYVQGLEAGAGEGAA